MEPILKVLKDYTSWKTSLKSVLEKNIDEVVTLVTDAIGFDQLIVLESLHADAPPMHLPGSIFSNTHSQFQNTHIIKGIVVNNNGINNEKLVWFYVRGGYHLINHASNLSLNLRPVLAFGQPAVTPYTSSFLASFDVKVEFLLAFVEWLPTLAELLKARMERVNPKDAEAEIQAFVAAVNDNG
jgi:hypothetical protein